MKKTCLTRSGILKILQDRAIEPDATAETLLSLAAELYPHQDNEPVMAEIIRAYYGCEPDDPDIMPFIDSLVADIAAIKAGIM